MIVHVTEFSSASNQCWLSLSGMSVVVFEVTTLLRRVRCRLFVTSQIVMASELSSAFIPAGGWGLMIMVMASSMAPEEMWLLPDRLWRALSGWVSRSDCASLRSAVVGVRKWSVPVVGVVTVSGVRSVARFLEGGMYWGSGLLRFGCAFTRFVVRFFYGGVNRGGSGLRLPECVVDQFFQSTSLLRDISR